MEVIDTLHECEVDTIMATGDNILTAISVATQCKIIEKNKKVYVGDILFNDQSNQSQIVWNSLDYTEKSNNTMQSLIH